MSDSSDKSTNTNEEMVPYVIFDYSKFNGSSIQYGSATNEKLYNILINILKEYIAHHDFIKEYDYDSDNSDSDSDSDSQDISNIPESELTCDECWCRVISTKYITVTNKGKLCSACNPSEIIINKKLITQFTKFLKKKGENCDIIYFKDGKWVDFEVI
jgi:hypothetical protein